MLMFSLLQCLWPSNLDRVVTYHKRLLVIKSQDSLIMWSSEITWQTRTIISPVPHYQWPLNLAVCWLLCGVPKQSYVTLWLRGLAKSRGKPKSYLHSHSVYSHQTWQYGVFSWGAPSHIVKWPFDHTVFRNYVTNWSSTCDHQTGQVGGLL